MPQFNQYSSPAPLQNTGTEVLMLAQLQGASIETVNETLFMLLPKLTLANLPVPAAGQQGWVCYVTNGRNTGEGSGAGTGCLCTINSALVWAAVWSGVQVTA